MELKQNKLYKRIEGGNDRITRGTHKNIRYKYLRNTKKMKNEIEDEISHSPIKKRNQHFLGRKECNYNYIPLFKYLLKQVGKNWDEIWKDVFPRVDNVAIPIQAMVLNINKNGTVNQYWNKSLANEVFKYNCTGKYYNYSYWHSLYVDENNLLQYVDKNYKILYTYRFNETITLDGKEI